jgi:hypothetical protein
MLIPVPVRFWMGGTKVFSFLDTILLMAPFAALMFLALFRMDERVADARAQIGRRRKFCEVGRDGRGVLSDPDGKSRKINGFASSSTRPRAEFVREGARSASARGEIQVDKAAIIIK